MLPALAFRSFALIHLFYYYFTRDPPVFSNVKRGIHKLALPDYIVIFTGLM